ncbi:MAG: RHS repeat-associated core domain-containing protein [Caldilineaceae bacterium]
MTYDLGGRKTAMSDPDLGSWSYAYNRRGQLTRQTDARGWTTCLYYDSLGRLATKYFQTSSTCPTSNSGVFRTIYTYDAGGGVNLGQLTSVAKYNGSGGLYANHSWSYDSYGRLASAGASVLGSAWHYTSYGYDAYSRLATLYYPDGEQLTTVYGAWGQPVKLQSSSWGVLVNGPMKDGPVSDAAAYDVTTQLAQTNYPAGNLIRNQSYYGWTSSDANNLGYANHRLANITVRTISTSLYRYATYLGYDTYASLKSRSEFVDNLRQENYTFAHDEQNRVSSGTYDGYNGNPASHTVTYTYADQGWPLRFETNGGTAFTQFRGHLSVPIPASYAYDANGNLTARLSKPGPTGNVQQALTWGAENVLERVTASGLDESYFYDENGMRAGKKDNLTGVITYYFFPHYENRNGVVTKYYSFGDMLVAKSEGGVLTYLHTDALGSVALETNTAGAVLADQRYYAYGRRLDTSGDTSGERDYTGQKIDQTGLLYYNARYYDPQLGQFISPDTIVPEPTNLLSYNRYLYAKGNPVINSDPTGHCAVAALAGPAGLAVDVPCWLSGAGEAVAAGTAVAAVGAVSAVALLNFALDDPLPDYPAPATNGDFDTVGESFPLPGSTTLTIEGVPLGQNLDLTTPNESRPDTFVPAVLADPSYSQAIGENIYKAISLPKGGTYLLIDPATAEVVRVGRTNDLERREAEHKRTYPEYIFRIDFRTDDYATQRGREQIIYDRYIPPLNKIRPISPLNSNLDKYLKAGESITGR